MSSRHGGSGRCARGRARAANEHGFADLKNWRVLTKLRLNARHATALLRALLVLARTEVSR